MLNIFWSPFVHQEPKGEGILIFLDCVHLKFQKVPMIDIRLDMGAKDRCEVAAGFEGTWLIGFGNTWDSGLSRSCSYLRLSTTNVAGLNPENKCSFTVLPDRFETIL